MIAALALLGWAGQMPDADSLLQLARRQTPAAMAVEARVRPLEVRDALTQALTRQDLEPARVLAGAYALAWSDSFLVREVERFAVWSPRDRAAKLWADSVRRAGVRAYGRDGPAAAIAIWRRALARAAAIPDTAGMAAIAGNLGAGFVELGHADSAQRYLERARRLATAVGDLRVEANAVGSLADASVDGGDLTAARDGYVRALRLRERIGDSRGVASVYNNLGLLAQQVGDLDEARRQFEAALALNRREGRDDVAASNLVNLAGLASLSGDFVGAERMYRDALAVWRAEAQWADAAVALQGLGQLELRRGDYPAAQEALSEALEIVEQTGPLAAALTLRRHLAATLAATGDLQGALDILRRAQDQADSGRASPVALAGLALARADLVAQLNASAEAERLYARAEFLYRQAGDAGGEAEAQQGRALLFLSHDDHARAQALLEGAVRASATAGNARSAALTRMSLGVVLRARRDAPSARRQLVRAERDLEQLGDPVGAAAALGERAGLEADLGHAAVAESLYRAALVRLGDRVAPDTRWRLLAGLGLARRAQGASDDAARALRAAVVEIERPGNSLRLAERRTAYLADKWDVYAELAFTQHAQGLTSAAFEASERLRARQMRELLASGRLAAPQAAAGDLIGREQDLRRRITELTKAIEPAPRGPEFSRGPDVLLTGTTRAALLRAQEQYTDLLLQLRERAPAHAALVSSDVAGWREIARRLAPSHALIEYLIGDSSALAFLVTRDTLVVVDLGTTRRELARLIEFTRGTLEPSGAPPLDSLWRGPLRQLHRMLIAPVEATGLLTAVTRLVVVPHAELHYLPFAALLADSTGDFLVQRYELAMAPSASVWLALANRPRSGGGTGTLAMAPRPDALPASQAEVAAIARVMDDARIRTGAAATEDALRREAGGYRVVHLATFGILNKQNPLFSFVELSPGGAFDGRLEVHEVFGLELHADLVVLSACQTGLASGTIADVPPGDDWVGLTRAFLHAGAAHVVATLWPVQDVATAALMERFYEHYAAAADPIRALAHAQRVLLANTATAHPFSWAGFVVAGAP